MCQTFTNPLFIFVIKYQRPSRTIFVESLNIDFISQATLYLKLYMIILSPDYMDLFPEEETDSESQMRGIRIRIAFNDK